MRIERRGVYTSTQAAIICGVAVGTIKKWIRLGMLPTDRLPVSGCIRIRHGVLMRFLDEHGLPVPAELTESEE